MSLNRWSNCAVSLLVLTLPSSVDAQSGAGAPANARTPPTRDSLNAISVRGQLLAEYDFVAALASDSVVARRPSPGDIQAYLGRLRGNRWDFAFGKPSVSGDTFFVSYEVKQRSNEPERFDVATFAPARADTGYYPRAARALALARADFGKPSRPYNAAIIERPSGPFWVYVMPAQLRKDVFPLGGDVRYLVDRGGRTILVKRQLHKSIIESAPAARGQDSAVAGTHTAILDDIPEDTDVFHVLVRVPRVPEYVITDAFVYHISTKGSITFVGRKSELLDDRKRAP